MTKFKSWWPIDHHDATYLWWLLLVLVVVATVPR